MSPLPATLILIPLKEEAAPVRRKLAAHPDVAVRIIGIGARNAERATRECLAAARPARVFTCGFAGGLNPDLEVGRVLFATQERSLAEVLATAGARESVFVQTPRIVVTAEEKRQLRRRSAADAVEMESSTVHAVCAEFRVPCATVRVISDAAGDDMPLDFNALAKPDQSLSFPRLLLAIARAPRCVPGLLRLQANCKLAAARLAATLEAAVRNLSPNAP